MLVVVPVSVQALAVLSALAMVLVSFLAWEMDRRHRRTPTSPLMQPPQQCKQ